MFCGCGEIGRRAGFRFLWATMQVQLLSSAPRQTEIEPEISICKRNSGFYLRKVRKKHKVKRLVLFLLPPQGNSPCEPLKRTFAVVVNGNEREGLFNSLVCLFTGASLLIKVIYRRNALFPPPAS